MPHPEDEEQGSEDWNPEKDKKHDKLLDRAMELMEKEHARQEQHEAGRVVNALDYFPSQQQISVRRIKNGYILTYFEAKEVPRSPMPFALPGLRFPEQVEVSFKTAAEGIPHFVAAIDNAELLAKSAALVEAAAAEQMKMVARARGGPVPPAIRRAVDPDPLRPVTPFFPLGPGTPENEPKPLEDPPPAQPS